MEKIGKYEKTKSFKSYVFWITGLPGSGKTTLGKKVLRYVKKNIGPSILIKMGSISLDILLEQEIIKNKTNNATNLSAFNFIIFIILYIYLPTRFSHKVRNISKE